MYYNLMRRIFGKVSNKGHVLLCVNVFYGSTD